MVQDHAHLIKRKNTGTDTLRITEIFFSIQGESLRVGLPTVFIRLTGCPLRCSYCDTAYAFQGGRRMALAEIMQEVRLHRTPYVTVTGGEPLAQPGCLPLLTSLCDQGYQVSLETGGALDIEEVDPRVMKIVDLKTPGSGEEARNRMQNLQHLRKADQLKFVICNRADYEWARAQVSAQDLTRRCAVLFSPAHGTLSATHLADWILEDSLHVRLQVQLHKYLWGDVPGK